MANLCLWEGSNPHNPQSVYMMCPMHMCLWLPPVRCTCVCLCLQSEAPHLIAVFQLAGCSVTALVSHWTRQVFLNHLDWPHLLLYLATTSLMGAHYQVVTWNFVGFPSSIVCKRDWVNLVVWMAQFFDLVRMLLGRPTGHVFVFIWEIGWLCSVRSDKNEVAGRVVFDQIRMK